MLDSLFVTPAIAAIEEALSAAHTEGKLAVVGNAKLASALAKRRAGIIAVGVSARAAKRLPETVADVAALEPGSLAAVIGVGGIDDAIAAWTLVVCPGGMIVLVDRAGARPDASRRALCAGLTEIEQRCAGRLVVTSGTVSTCATWHT